MTASFNLPPGFQFEGEPPANDDPGFDLPPGFQLEPKKPPQRGMLGEAAGSFVSTLAKENPEGLAEALEGFGVLTGVDTGSAQAFMRNLAKKGDTGFKPQVGSLADIGSVSDFGLWVAQGLGQGVASTIPSLVTGGAGAAIGSAAGPVGTVAGAAIGATTSSLPMNFGDAYKQLKGEGIDPATASKAAAVIAAPVTALDLYGLGKITGVATKPVKDAAIKIIAKRIKEGSLTELTTEAMQQAIQEAGAAYLSGNLNLGERGLRTVESGLIGGLTGGALSPIGAASDIRRAAKLPPEKPPGDQKSGENPVPPDAPAKGLIQIGRDEGELLFRGKGLDGRDVVMVRFPDGSIETLDAADPLIGAERPLPEKPPAAPRNLELDLRNAGIRTAGPAPSKPEAPIVNQPQAAPPPMEAALRAAGLRDPSVPAGPDVDQGELSREAFADRPGLPKPATVYGAGFTMPPGFMLEQPGPDVTDATLRIEREQENARIAATRGLPPPPTRYGPEGPGGFTMPPTQPPPPPPAGPPALPKPSTTYGPGFTMVQPDAYAKARALVEQVPYGKPVPFEPIAQAAGVPLKAFGPIRDELAKNGLIGQRGQLWIRTQPQQAQPSAGAPAVKPPVAPPAAAARVPPGPAAQPPTPQQPSPAPAAARGKINVMGDAIAAADQAKPAAAPSIPKSDGKNADPMQAAPAEAPKPAAEAAQAPATSARDRLESANVDIANRAKRGEGVYNDMLAERAAEFDKLIADARAEAGDKKVPYIEGIAERLAQVRPKAAAAAAEAKPRKTIDDLRAENRKRVDEAAAVIAKAGGKNVVLQDKRNPQKGALISRDIDEPGKFRVTWFDKDGFSGHTVYNTEDEAVRQALGTGYQDTNPNLLRELSKLPSFAEGNERADQMQRENAERAAAPTPAPTPKPKKARQAASKPAAAPAPAEAPKAPPAAEAAPAPQDAAPKARRRTELHYAGYGKVAVQKLILQKARDALRTMRKRLTIRQKDGRWGLELRTGTPDEHASVKRWVDRESAKAVRRSEAARKRGGPKPKDYGILGIVSLGGGIVDTGGEIKGADLDRWHLDKPGFNKLIREAGPEGQGNMLGSSLDEEHNADWWGREFQHMGFLPRDTGEGLAEDRGKLALQLILDAAADEDVNMQSPPYGSREDPLPGEAEKEEQAEHDAWRDDAEAQADQLGIDPTGMSDDELIKAVADRVSDLERPDVEAESAASDSFDELENAIPGFEAPDVAQPGLPPEQGEAPGRGVEGSDVAPESAGNGGDAGGRPAQPGEGGAEAPGAIDRIDAGDQRVVPGAERISDRELAERRGAQPLKPTTRQAAPDDGLFNVGGRGQSDMMDMPGMKPGPLDTPSTLRHFNAWLDRQYDGREDERARAEAQMRRLLKDDPDLAATHSWSEIRDRAERLEEMAAEEAADRAGYKRGELRDRFLAGWRDAGQGRRYTPQVGLPKPQQAYQDGRFAHKERADRQGSSEKPAPDQDDDIPFRPAGAAFDRWFGDSKVVDENGEPMVVYHGSPVRDFTEFDKNAASKNDPDAPVVGFWFSEGERDADRAGRFPYGRPNAPNAQVRPFYLSIKNPATRRDLQQARKTLRERDGNHYPTNEEITAELQRAGFDGYVHHPIMRVSDQQKRDLAAGKRVQLDRYRSLEPDGHGGIDLFDDRVGGHVTGYSDVADFEQSHPAIYVAFEPGQIKSADANTGTYDRDNPDIRYRADKQNAPQPGVREDITALLRRLLGKKVDIEIADEIMMPTGELASGEYINNTLRPLIRIALDSDATMADTMRHEVIHALRRLGLIDEKSWNVLMRAAPGWRKRFKINEVFRGLNLSEEELHEEAVAEAYPAWANGELNVMGPAAKIFERIRSFFEGLRNWIDGNGWLTAADVFTAIEGGQYAKIDTAAMPLKNQRDAYRITRASLQNRANTVLDAMRDWRGTLARFGDPLGAIAKADLYKDIRNLTMGKIGAWDRRAREINDTFNAADAADQKRIYEYLTTAGASPNAISNDKVRDAAVQAKQWIDQLGVALVQRRVLRPETYLAYKDSYLPRLYLRYILGHDLKTGQPLGGSGGRPSRMGYAKERKELSEEVRKLVLGEIDDPAFLSAVNLSVKGRDVAILDLLRQIADNPDWVAAGQMVEWRGQQVTPQWLAAEADYVRKQVPHMKPERQAAATALAAEMQTQADTALEAQRDFPSQYKQVPDSKRYGALRGLWIDKSIYNDLLTSVGMQNPDPSWAEQLLGVGGYGTRATQMWKLGKIALNPPTQFRNIMSNVVLLNMGGVPLYRIPDTLAKAFSAMRTNGEAWKVAQKYGITSSGFTANELYRFEHEFVDLAAKQGGKGAQVRRIAQRFLEGAGDLYQGIESVFKTAYIIDAMERRGQSEAEAARGANHWLLDYSLVPPWVRYLRNSPFGIPFLSWTYKSLPRIIEAAATRPWVVGGWTFGLAYGLAEWFKSANDDMDDEDLKALMKTYPDYIRDKGNVYVLPFKDSAGRWQFVDFSYMLPWGQAQEAVNKSLKGEPGELVKTVGLFGAPLANLAVAALSNIDPFTNRPITNKNDPPAQKVSDTLMYVWTLAAPPWATENGFAKKIYDAANMKPVDKAGNPGATMPQAITRFFGINIYGLDPDLQRGKNIDVMQHEIQQIKSRRTQIARDQRLSAADRKERTDELEAYLRNKADALKTYIKESELPPKLRARAERVQ